MCRPGPVSPISELRYSLRAPAGVPRGLRIFFRDDQSDFADFRPSRNDIGTRKITGSPERSCGGSDIGKWDYKGTVSYYKPDLFFGSHEFKTGVNYEPGWGYGTKPSPMCINGSGIGASPFRK